VRVAVRLVVVMLIGVGAGELHEAVVFALFDLPQENGIAFGRSPVLAIVSLTLAPVVWGAMGATLIRLDRRRGLFETS